MEQAGALKGPRVGATVKAKYKPRPGRFIGVEESVGMARL